MERPPRVYVTGGSDGGPSLGPLGEGRPATAPRLVGPVTLHTATPRPRRGTASRQVRVAQLHGAAVAVAKAMAIDCAQRRPSADFANKGGGDHEHVPPASLKKSRAPPAPRAIAATRA